MNDLMSQKYACRYGERLVFIKKVPVKVCSHEAYVYLCIDEDMYLMQHKKTILNALDDKKDSDETVAAIMQKLQQELLKLRSRKAKSLNAESIFSYLRNQKCKVYKDYAIPQEPRKEANAIFDIFKVKVPNKIPFTTNEV